MKILMIGGTRFVGRHLAEAVLAAGHDLSLFHRGQTNVGLFPQATEILGDRDGGLDALGDATWDVVIDTCGYVPRLVSASADALRGRVQRYVFVSTISVYDWPQAAGVTEATGRLATMDDETTETIDKDTYGPLKVLCERVLDERFPGAALHLRAGLIVGPHDSTDRFTYWPVRVAKGGPMIAAGRDGDLQFVDGRDLAAFAVHAIEQGLAGAYNVTGPADRLTMGSCLETMVETLNPAAELVWIPEDFLLGNGAIEWKDFPFWLKEGSENAGILSVDNRKAIADGLTFRPHPDTFRDTLDWYRNHHPTGTLITGISAEREAELLEAWGARSAETPGTPSPRGSR
jgi:2'-hydroxyisoflavone reductase